MTRFDRFDFTVWSILGGLALVLGAVILLGDRVGAQVVQTWPAAGEAVAAYGRVGLTFAQPMQAASVAAHFSITPAIAGSLQWRGQQALFLPTVPLAQGVTYTAHLSAGAEAQNGRATKEDLTWSFTVRSPRLVYLAPASKGALDLVQITPGGNPLSLTQTGGRVYDFAVAPDGEHIVYSLVNEQGGVDLWLMEDDGANARLFIECLKSRCSVPHWAPDGARIAYSREEEGIAPGAPLGPPRVWTAQVDTGATQPLYQDSQVLGYGPVWSPDGQRLAFFDGSVGGIRVLDLASGGEMVLPTLMGLVGAFAPDGQAMFFTDVQAQPNSVVGILYLADFGSQTITAPLSETLPFSDFGVPEWSQTREWIALSAKVADGGPGRQLWVLRPDGSDAHPIAADPAYTHGSYHWDAWGQQLVYQRVALGTPFPQPEIWVWSATTGAARQVATDGTLPMWLP